MEYVTNKISGAVSARAITPSDTVNFADGVCRALYITASGNLSVLLANDAAPIVYPVVATEIMPVNAIRVYATGTTTATCVAWY